MKKIFVALLAMVVLTACGSKDKPNERTYKVGIHGGDSGQAWNYVTKELEKEGITLKIVSFQQYPEPNAALNDKEIDLNAFQHYAYLNKEVAEFNYKIEAIADTYIAPMGSYSSTINSLDELKDGAKILIPNDVTNGGRALELLNANGLIKLGNAAGTIPELKDVINPRNFDIIQLSAASIPGSLADASLAVINSGIAVDANLKPSESLFIEKVDLDNKEPFKEYINLIAVRSSDIDNKDLKRIVELYQSDAVRDIILEDSKGSNYPVF